ncbi:nuclear transport factor 2 family protein [Brevundimonas vitis]|uniref:Nuclear transport factor 2 family protein n=1 Tax=Brevundimonas vitisensis TaxID=2800818 RepID=A0ABX7BNW5_9CAUL|nr:nuclear transport factor 2 family protein [Brevundimonas vitisensis]QQQ18936.1 nuclear transport factor 2 family protein [Brevundimonas vitisensis]
MIASLTAMIAASALSLSGPEEDVAAVLDQLNVASTAADAEAYFGLFTPDARFIGTDASERWSLDAFRAFAEPYFAQGRGWTYTPVARHITIAPIPCRCIAWFDEELSNASYGVTRGSGVLRLTENGWKIEQYVLSFAIPNDKADAVVAVVRETPAP